LDDVLAKLYAKRGTKKPIDPAIRLNLMVPFARKDEAKKLGAKWDASEKTWWLEKSDAAAIAKAVKLGFVETPD
jgi:hypothetical protein